MVCCAHCERIAAHSRCSFYDRQIKAFCPDFVIEAATENLDLKKKIFTDLTSLTAPEVILATNTSSISITKIAAATNRPEKVGAVLFLICPLQLALCYLL